VIGVVGVGAYRNHCPITNRYKRTRSRWAVVSAVDTGRADAVR